jgi:hypothetical protein
VRPDSNVPREALPGGALHVHDLALEEQSVVDLSVHCFDGFMMIDCRTRKPHTHTHTNTHTHTHTNHSLPPRLLNDVADRVAGLLGTQHGAPDAPRQAQGVGHAHTLGLQ